MRPRSNLVAPKDRRQLTKQQKKYGPMPGQSRGKGLIGFYPEVASEEDTLSSVIKGRSIARLGDGELNIAMGGTCISQRIVPPGMQAEMLKVLHQPGKCMVGIPNVFSRTPKRESWTKYATTDVVRKCFPLPKYVSAFITRPDSAPWIDVPAYWDKVGSLWRDREVTLVYGGPDSKSLKPHWLMANGCAKVHEVIGKRTNAYVGIDELEERIGKPSHPIILCLGPTATILAWRLANRGLWAVDLGHVGMFIKTPGNYTSLDQWTTPGYRDTLVATHAKYQAEGKPWGVSGQKYAEQVKEFYHFLKCESLLDYGCGQQTLKKTLGKIDPSIPCSGYDPGIPGKAVMPKPADLVTCTDVMEHVERDKVDLVLNHIFSLAHKGVYFSIACGGSKETLTDGRDAHLVIEKPGWWVKTVQRAGWHIDKYEDLGKQVKIWVVRDGK